MSECGWLSDRIPAVVLGRAEWTLQEVRHLNECLACQQEWEIVRATSRLGEGVAEKLDPDTVASSLLQRLRRDQEVQRLRRTWTVGGLAAAAAIAVALWTGALNSPTESAFRSGSRAGWQLAIPLPELETLHQAELDSVFQTMDEPNATASNEEEPDLHDLNSDELERVLDSWEG